MRIARVDKVERVSEVEFLWSMAGNQEGTPGRSMAGNRKGTPAPGRVMAGNVTGRNNLKSDICD